MKKKMQCAFIMVLILASAVVLFGCMQPLELGARSGSAQITIGAGAARTIQPSDAEIVITSHIVSGVGPNNEVLSDKSFTTSTHTESNLIEGEWTFTVKGLNAAGSIVASGTAKATIVANATTNVAVTLTPVKDGTGVGTFTLSGTIPSTLTLSSFTGTIAPSTGGADINFTATVNGTSITYSNNTLPVGSYIVTLVASKAAGEWRAVYALRIYQGKTSPLSLALTANDFVSVTSPALTINPASITNGTQNQSYTFTLNASGLPSNLSQVTFNWNFGDATTGNKAVSVSNGTATTTISHSYTASSAYGLVVTVSDGATTLATTHASVLIGTTNAGTDYDLTVLNQWQAANSGGYGITVDTWDISVLPTGCVFDLRFDAYSMPDKYIVEYPDGTIVYDSGWRGDSSYSGAAYPGGVAGTGYGEKLTMFAKGAQQHFKITIIGGEPGTAWEYSIKARNP